MTAYYGQHWANCALPYVMQPRFEPETAVTPLALRCSALDRCDTREPERVRHLNVLTLARLPA
jgi:hypothetical protein